MPLVRVKAKDGGSPPPVDQPGLVAVLKSKMAPGGDGGDGGAGGCMGGSGGGVAPQITLTSATAASPHDERPRSYSNWNDCEESAMLAASHDSP